MYVCEYSYKPAFKHRTCVANPVVSEAGAQRFYGYAVLAISHIINLSQFTSPNAARQWDAACCVPDVVQRAAVLAAFLKKPEADSDITRLRRGYFIAAASCRGFFIHLFIHPYAVPPCFLTCTRVIMKYP